MALYDNPPQVDPATGRLPSYKQVLQQDPATGVYKIKYEYTPITSSSTQGQTLQTMLTTPVTDFGISMGTGGGSQDDDTGGGDTGGDTGVGTEGGATGGEGRQGGFYDFQRQDGGGRAFGESTDTRSELQKQLDAAYPTFLERGLGVAGGVLLSGISPFLGTASSTYMTSRRKNAIADIDQAMEDGTFLSGYKTSEIAKALEDNSNLPDNVADYMRNAVSMSNITPVKRPTQTQVSTQVAPTTFQGITQDYLDSLPDTPMKGPNVGGLGITPTKKPSIQERMDQAKLDAAARGGSRDTGEKASIQAFNDATSGFKYDGAVNTSFKGTPQENTQIGTFSERRAKEEEGRKEDGTAEEGSVANLRDIKATQTQPKAREVDRSNPVSNKAGKNEVSDKNGNAVTDKKGNAINFGGKKKDKDKGGGGKSGGRVICSELYRQGLIPKEDWRLDLWYTQNYLNRKHIVGYWYYAIPMVKIMRKNKLVTNIWKHIAINRTQDIKWRLGTGKFNLLGRIYSIVLETTANILGHFVKEKDYTVLYKGETQWQ